MGDVLLLETGTDKLLLEDGSSFLLLEVPDNSYSQLILGTTGLRGYWRLGELSGAIANDSSTYVNHGDYAAAVQLGRSSALAGAGDTAAGFVGTATDVNVDSASNPTALDVGDTFTVECWFQRAAGRTGIYEVLMSKGNGAYTLWIYPSNQVYIVNNGTSDTAHSSTAIADTAWHHAVGTKTGATRAVYLDGVDLTVLDSNSTFGDNVGVALGIGGLAAEGGNFFAGQLDEVALYSVALSAQQVLDHYNYGIGTARRFRGLSPVVQAVPRAAVR